MGRHKSQHGLARKIYLRYRQKDPKYAALESFIERAPAGPLNGVLLDLLLESLLNRQEGPVGIAALTISTQPQENINVQPPSNNAVGPGLGAALLFEGILKRP